MPRQFLGIHLCEVSAIGENGTGCRPVEPRHQVEQRGLSGARATQQREKFSGVDPKCHLCHSADQRRAPPVMSRAPLAANSGAVTDRHGLAHYVTTRGEAGTLRSNSKALRGRRGRDQSVREGERGWLWTQGARKLVGAKVVFTPEKARRPDDIAG